MFSVVSIEKTPFLFKVAVFRLQLGLMLLSQHVLHSYLPKKLYPCGGSTVIRRFIGKSYERGNGKMSENRKITNKILESDIDLILVEELKCDPDFLKLFLDQTDWPEWRYDPQSVKTYRSVSTAFGETDVTAVLTYPDGSRRALLIEDKINAPTQKEQSQRYVINGENLIQEEGYTSVKTFLVAPAKYIRNHKTDDNITFFKERITYERLIAFFKERNDVRSLLKAELLDVAVTKHSNGSDKIVNKDITRFWYYLRKYVKKRYPQLIFVSTVDEKSYNDQWVEWRSPIPRATVYWKADKGYIDLQVPACANRVDEFKASFGDKLLRGMEILPASKSAVFRMHNACWELDFRESFPDNIVLIDHALSYAALVYAFANTLDPDVFK